MKKALIVVLLTLFLAAVNQAQARCRSYPESLRTYSAPISHESPALGSTRFQRLDRVCPRVTAISVVSSSSLYRME
jgi:hypothetical protein